MNYNNKIFKIKSEKEFEYYAIRIFRMQYKLNPVYQSYCNLIGTDLNDVKKLDQIPFLPIEFFKTKKVKSFKNSISNVKKVDKPWGYEIWMANNEANDYCGKILFIKKKAIK